MPEIRIERVAKRFGSVEALQGVSLTIGHGELVVLLGPTGAGKTHAAAAGRRPGTGRCRPHLHRRPRR